ncbi:Sucrose synthase, partial [Sesbania bispinosa]
VTRLIPDAQGTKCNQELEPIIGTKNSNILRVPFQIDKGILRQWVSRFDIYPYLERFTQDATGKILNLMEGKPDLIIGNYTNGNELKRQCLYTTYNFVKGHLSISLL